MKTLKMLVVLGLVAFLAVFQSDKAMAFDTELLSCPIAETLKKGEWKIGTRLWYGVLPLTGYVKIGITSNIEALGFVELGNVYYGLKIKCLEEKEKIPAVTVGFCEGFAGTPVRGIGAGHGDSYNINCLYLILSKNIGDLSLNTGIGKGNNPPLVTMVGDGFYNLDGYFAYGSIEKKVGKAKIFLEINEFKGKSTWGIGGSYKVKNFLFKLTGGIWSEKFFKLPKNEDYFLMPVLTIEYNKRKGN